MTSYLALRGESIGTVSCREKVPPLAASDIITKEDTFTLQLTVPY